MQGDGELVDLLAPGCAIESSAVGGGNAALKCGTSMAAPYAAGVGALVAEYVADQGDPALTPAEMEDLLERSGVPVVDHRLPEGSPEFPRVAPLRALQALDADAPSDLTVVAAGPDGVELSWTPGATADGLRLYRSGPSSAEEVLAELPASATGFTDTDPVCGTISYRLVGVTGGVESLSVRATARVADCPPPANDLRDDADPVPAAVGERVVRTVPDVWAATASDDDPVHSCRWNAPGVGHQTVWYEVAPTTAVWATVSTAQSTGAVDDTTVSVYRVDGDTLVERQCSEDIGANVFTSRLTTRLDAGERYLVQVSQWAAVEEGAAGELVVAFDIAAAGTPPTHDRIGDARVIGETPYRDEEPAIAQADSTVDDPVHPCVDPQLSGPRRGGQTVWYRYTPEEDVRFDVATTGSTGTLDDTILTVFDGAPGALRPIACNDDVSDTDWRSQLTGVDLDGGVTYHVLVSRWNAGYTPGPATLVLTAETSPARPVLAAIDPTTGSLDGGETVTLTGERLADATVTFGGVAATILAATDTSITATTPPRDQVGPVDVTVTSDAGSSTLGGGYTYTGTATISIAQGSLTRVADGTPKPVTVTTDPAGLDVTVTYSGATTAPSAPGTYAVVATLDEAHYVAEPATATLVIAAPPAPSLTRVTPAEGPLAGSQVVTITGQNLTGSTVRFGNRNGTNVTATATRVTATTPAGAAVGPVPVRVTTPTGGTATLTDAYRYIGDATISNVGGLDRVADGSPKPVTVTTTPAGLAVLVTYARSGSAPTTTAPSAPGTYTVRVELDEPYHTATPVTRTLRIAPAPVPPPPGPAPAPSTPVARGLDRACPPGGTASRFPDVPPDSVHARAIGCLSGRQLIQGFGDGSYGPSREVTRGQIISVIDRALVATDLDLPRSPRDAFRDDDGSVHEAATNRLAALGIVQGSSSGRSNSTSPVTRAQLLALLVRTYEVVAGEPLPPGRDYFDDDDGHVLEDEIEAGAAAGITGGTRPRVFEPGKATPRDQVASLVARWLDLLIENDLAS